MFKNNYDGMLRDLARYLVNFAPSGAAREVNRLHAALTRGDDLSDYFSFEFRPSDDVSCTLYVRAQGPDGKYGNTRIEDEEGNLWYAFVVKCEVSWPTWGADDLQTTQRRLALMTEVTRFACQVEREFAGVFHNLSQTKAERDALAISNAKNRAKAVVERAVLANVKGMKVGQGKVVAVDGDVSQVTFLDVTRTEGGRTFKYTASVGQCSIAIERVA